MLIRTVVGVYPVDRTTACGRSGKDLQLSVSVTVRLVLPAVTSVTRFATPERRNPSQMDSRSYQ
ncbi:hypothetical protein GBQ70_12065 [Halomicrobium sp. ZPS1]|nr:hypothetical protein GBQ70_12065 [Halomicrobium sp. ZPS1]